MGKVKYHVLVLTAENALIYVRYDEPKTHLEIYQDFHKLSVEVKDCFISEGDSFNLADMLLKSVSRWVIRNFEEDLDISSISVRNYKHKNQHIIMDIKGQTQAGKPFVVKPSELLSSKTNLFSDFC